VVEDALQKFSRIIAEATTSFIASLPQSAIASWLGVFVEYILIVVKKRLIPI
jgi:hypothetical protein